jgi:nucleoside-triphosphatase
VMSHVDIQSPLRVGRYGVDIEGSERFLVSLPFMAASHVVIDEIAKMECLSEHFQRLVTAILDRDLTCIATIALRGTGFIESIKQRPDVTPFAIDRGNRDKPCKDLPAVSLPACSEFAGGWIIHL